MSIVFLSDSAKWCQPLADILGDKLGVRAAVLDTETIVGGMWEPSLEAGKEQLLMATGAECKVLVNRMSARPGGDTQASATIFRSLIASLAIRRDVAQSPLVVVNGAKCHEIGVSKLLQAAVMGALGVRTPRTLLVTRGTLQRVMQQLSEGAEGEGQQWLLKPNVGGKGAGIIAVSAAAALPTDLDSTFGPDGTAVLQQVIDAPDRCVHRVELVNFKPIYTAHVPVDDGNYNNCLSDVCSRPKKKIIQVEKPKEGDEVLADCAKIAAACEMHLGSVEYLVDRQGVAWFIDINPVSTVMKEAEAAIGIHPMLLQAQWLQSIVTSTPSAVAEN